MHTITNINDTDRSLKISVTPHNDTERSNSKLTITSSNGTTGPLLKSTLKKQQRSWIDPYEPAIQDTFYHKELKQLRPNFENVQVFIILLFYYSLTLFRLLQSVSNLLDT